MSQIAGVETIDSLCCPSSEARMEFRSTPSKGVAMTFQIAVNGIERSFNVDGDTPLI
jgi:hypothetical protein